MALTRDVAFEIARQIEKLRDFMAFTAATREWRELLYNHALTVQFCIILRPRESYISQDLIMFAEKARFYIQLEPRQMIKHTTSMLSFITFSCPTVMMYSSSGIVCENCAFLYAKTKNRIFAESCALYYNYNDNDRHKLSRLCYYCKKLVCLLHASYDYTRESPFCLNCSYGVDLCKNCNIIPLTNRFRAFSSRKYCCVCSPYECDRESSAAKRLRKLATFPPRVKNDTA